MGAIVGYDTQLASRVREIFADGPPVLERAMFGGLAFLVAGKIAVAASAQGGLLVRVGAARAEEIVRTTAAQPMQMGERIMRGWVHVDAEHVSSRHQLAEWIDVGIASATSA